jgi:hypothetical protein
VAEVRVAATNLQTGRVSARAVLRDRLFVATSAAAVSGAVSSVLDSGYSGLVVVDPQCGRTAYTIKSMYGSRLVVGKDTAAYLHYIASESEPMWLPSLFDSAAYSLDECMRAQLADGVDFALTPTGQVRDPAVLRAAVAAANALTLPGVVVAAPVPNTLLADAALPELVAALEGSRHPVALIVTGDFDPFADARVALALRAIAASSADVFLHRSDFATFEALAYGGLGGSIGYIASLRHTVTGRKPSRTRKNPPDQSPIVLLPDIDSFRHHAVFEPWFRNTRPPICSVAGCCERDLTTLHDPTRDRPVANQHNLRAWLPLARQLTSAPASQRRAWLHAYRQDVRTAYVDLRRRTQVRDIPMDDSQTTWLTLGM